MPRSVPQVQQLRLHGPPRLLRLTSAAIPKDGTGTLTLPTIGEGGGAMSVPAHIVSRRGEAGQLRVRLPRSTRPGIYAAQLEIAGEEHSVEVNVEAQEQLVVRPAQATFEGEPGGAAETTLALSNRGNVSIAVPTTFAIGMFDNDAMEAAFASTYRQETDDALKLFSHWVHKLRDGYGGLLKCSVAVGAGELEPGEQRTITIKTTLPGKLKPGHAYHGVLELGPLAQSVDVKVNKRERGYQK